MLTACGGLVYMQANRPSPDAAAVPAGSATSSSQQESSAAEASAPEAASSTTATAAAEAPATSGTGDVGSAATQAAARPDTLEQWIKDTRHSDPKIRAAAITKLGNAPKAQALPALEDVLETGDPETDRHIALNSLHTLALRDGDKNGQVRDVMRSAIYHSDNDAVMQTAQSLLDDVEAALSGQTPKQN